MIRLKKRKWDTVVVGSGAAGLNAADRLWQYGVRDLALVTEDMNAGTSRNTGSDKQTYYKLSLAGETRDSVRQLAKALYDGGCVDGEHALCEAALSCRAFYRLVELGVPFPHNPYGEYVGYKTDHDPCERGTSVGPYTSRSMTEVLERAVREKEIQILDGYQVIRILSRNEMLYGILCLNCKEESYELILCTNLVYAVGGPAGIYKDSVYPVSQFGASGLAFEAGVCGKNLTEWQYGIASLRPRWNVSGSYMQVIPRVISTDANGREEREFLLDYYKSREAMMNMVFLKGYQWPFHAGRAAKGSSMIDLLVYRETCVRGRRVWLDYRNNPGSRPVEWEKLSSETRDYLVHAGADAPTPYERLCRLNSPAVSFYREHGVDLEREMLEIAVCAQHNNGGLAVDGWWQSNVEGMYVAGEAAATYGITRPGGSALNAGQVGSMRAAEAIAARKERKRVWTIREDKEMERIARERIVMGELAADRGYADAARWREATQNMSRYGAMMRNPSGICHMREEIRKDLKELLSLGKDTGQGEHIENDHNSDISVISEKADTERIHRLSQVYRYYDMRLCQKVYLDAMADYQNHGVKSRGSAIYEEEPGAPDQITIPELVTFSLDGPDGRDHDDVVQEIHYVGPEVPCECRWRPVRKLEDIRENESFEVVWKAFRESTGKNP
ncbi:MAG: FAD-binding protein [Clostridiales bacterium]|nr:FAD-binding protein [Clostridiales bacterium]